MPETATHRTIGKRKRKGSGTLRGRLRRQASKMLAVMESQEASSVVEPASAHSAEFLSTGRTGRRNAMPDILGEHAVVSSGDLPARLQGLSTGDGAAGPSTSAAAAAAADAAASKQPDAAS